MENQNIIEQLLKNEDLIGRKTSDPLHQAFGEKKSSPMMGGGMNILQRDFTEMWKNATCKAKSSVHRSVYLHIPFCRLRCTYCGFFKNFKNEDRQSQYAKYLLQEIRSVKGNPYIESSPVEAIYFGGGTPGVLKPQEIKQLLDELKNNIPIAKDCEITFETSLCDLDDDQLAACLEGGVNRFSFGVQTFDTEVRRSVGRPDSKERLIERLTELRKMQNQAAIVIDLIYGFPNQTMETWKEDIQIASSLPLDGLDIYSLKVFPGSLLDEQIKSGKLPSAADRPELADMYVYGTQYFEQIGMRKLSICHWGKFDLVEKSRYNHFSKSAETTIPFGAGAGGNIEGMRIMQESDVDRYEEKVEAGIKPIAMAMPAEANYKLYGRIRGDMDCGFLSFVDLEREFQLPIGTYLKPLFELWETRGLVNQSRGRVELTLAGQVWNVEMINSTISFLKAQITK